MTHKITNQTMLKFPRKKMSSVASLTFCERAHFIHCEYRKRDLKCQIIFKIWNLKKIVIVFISWSLKILFFQQTSLSLEAYNVNEPSLVGYHGPRGTRLRLPCFIQRGDEAVQFRSFVLAKRKEFAAQQSFFSCIFYHQFGENIK